MRLVESLQGLEGCELSCLFDENQRMDPAPSESPIFTHWEDSKGRSCTEF